MDEVKRVVAGYLCFGVFHSLNAVGATLSHILRENNKGLTSKEMKFISSHKQRIHQEAQTFRKLGRRLTR